MRVITACMATGLAVLLAACSPAAPSISPAATIAVGNVSCEQPPQIAESGAAVRIVLECQRAVAAALSVVQEHRADIERIEFHYGGYCLPGTFCALSNQTNHGYVVLHFGGSPTDLTDYAGDFMVFVEADDAGNVTATSGLELLPTSPIVN